MNRKRRILQPLLMLSVVLVGAGVVVATLNGRPDIRRPKDKEIEEPYRASNFQLNLAIANKHLLAMADAVDGQRAPQADNHAIARRLSLALVGSGLSLEEMRAFSEVAEDRQIQWLTTYLLEDRRWSDYFAERLSRAFVGTNDGPFLLFRRRKFNAWLSEQLRDDVSYNVIVREMLSAEGLWTDKPEVNFVTATMDEANEGRGDPIRLAGRTSRAFLAQRIDCLQCHDDFLGDLNFGSAESPVDGRQEHFHSLAAFYSGTALANPFRGICEDKQTYDFEYLGESEMTRVEPAVPFAPELLPSEGKPRVRLAAWVTHPDNRAFARATVNRIWALMFSRPLVAPVDNIPLDESVPPIMDLLAADFAAHGFDLKRLIRMIVETDAFRRDSRADFEVTEDHELAWSVFPVTQLRPEQVSGSLFQACSLSAMDSTSPILTRLKVFGDGQDFLRNFGDRGEDEFESSAVTIPQRLLLMNGNLVSERTKVDLIGNASTRIAQMVQDDQQAVELTFLSVLNRSPSLVEVEAFSKYLHGKSGDDRSRAMGDVYWAIINSTEFSWNH